MPRQIDLLSLFVDRLASAIAQHLNGAMPSGRQPKAAAVAAAPARNRRRRKGQKRSPLLIERTTAALLAHIKSSPGERIEQIAKAIGVPTSELKLPAQKLIADKDVKTKGQKRGTQYFAA